MRTQHAGNIMHDFSMTIDELSARDLLIACDTVEEIREYLEVYSAQFPEKSWSVEFSDWVYDLFNAYDEFNI